jgi:hypothetical protein
MNISLIIILLASLTALFSALAAGMGLFFRKTGSPYFYQSLRGTKVQIYGQGLYRYDTLFFGAGFKGQDTVALFLGVPLLIYAILMYTQGSLVGHLLLLGFLGYFLYLYASMAFGASYNPIFLIYVIIFSSSLYGFILAFRSALIRLSEFNGVAEIAGRGTAIYLMIAGAITLFVWGEPLIKALIRNTTPARMDSYTTMVTYALDLAVISPATFIAGWLILQGNVSGVLLSISLLTLIILLAPQIILSTIFQRSAGVDLSKAEMLGPVIGFVILGGVGLGLLINLLMEVSKIG